MGHKKERNKLRLQRQKNKDIAPLGDFVTMGLVIHEVPVTLSSLYGSNMVMPYFYNHKQDNKIDRKFIDCHMRVDYCAITMSCQGVLGDGDKGYWKLNCC